MGNAVGAVAQSGFDRLLAELASAMVRTTNLAMTFWMKVPSANPLTTPYSTGGQPTPLPLSPQLTDAIASARGSLLALAGVVGFVGIVIASVRAVRHNRAGEMLAIPEMLFRLIAVSMFGVVAVWVSLQASDLYASWILERAQPGFGSAPSPGLIKEQWIIEAGLVTGGLQVLVGVLASLAQIVFMFFRGALLLLLLVLWPTAAAGTATESGLSAFKKLNAWIIALLLYKPIAATIYAVGFLTYARTDVEQGFGGEVMSLLLGTTILVLAALALPMLVRFVMPPAGVGASSAFSGGAAAAGVATGAVAVAGVAAGGVGLAATGSGSAAMGTGAGMSMAGSGAGGSGSGGGGSSFASGGDLPSGGGGVLSGEGSIPGQGADSGGGASPAADAGPSPAVSDGASVGSVSGSGGAALPQASAGSGVSGAGDSASEPASAASGSAGPSATRLDGAGAGSAGPGALGPAGAGSSGSRPDWRAVADLAGSERERDDVWEGQ